MAINESIKSREMLDTIRKNKNSKEMLIESELGKAQPKEYNNMYRRFMTLMEEATMPSQNGGSVVITKDASEFGDVKSKQEELIKQTVGEQIKFDNNSLVYTPGVNGQTENLTLTGTLPQLGINFKFNYNDSKGNGVYIWANELALTDNNLRTIGKIKDSYENWRDSITNDGELMERLARFVEQGQ